MPKYKGCRVRSGQLVFVSAVPGQQLSNSNIIDELHVMECHMATASMREHVFVLQ